MGKFENIIEKSFLFFIKTYRFFISPLLGENCRFYPSCSCYAEIAIKEHGLIKGLFLAVKRLLCCHPWHLGGYDPVPKKKQEKNDKN